MELPLYAVSHNAGIGNKRRVRMAEVGALFGLGGLCARSVVGAWMLRLNELPVAIERHLPSTERCRVVFWLPKHQRRYARLTGRDFMDISTDNVLTFRELRRAQGAVAAYREAKGGLVSVYVTPNVEGIGGCPGQIVGVDQNVMRFLVAVETANEEKRLFAVLPQDLDVVCQRDAIG